MNKGQFLLLMAALALNGCALLGKAEPLDVRYYDAVEPAAKAAPVSAGGEQGARRLRLGTIKSAHHLDERILTRTDGSEVIYHDSLRWTERPAEFVRRALSKDLYESAGFTRVLSGPATTLEVELTAFEEISGGRARVEMNVVLHDDREQLLQRTVRVEVPVEKNKELGEGLAVALGSALGKAAHEVTGLTAETLNQVVAKREAQQRLEQGVAERALTPATVAPPAP